MDALAVQFTLSSLVVVLRLVFSLLAVNSTILMFFPGCLQSAFPGSRGCFFSFPI